MPPQHSGLKLTEVSRQAHIPHLFALDSVCETAANGLKCVKVHVAPPPELAKLHQLVALDPSTSPDLGELPFWWAAAKYLIRIFRKPFETGSEVGIFPRLSATQH